MCGGPGVAREWPSSSAVTGIGNKDTLRGECHFVGRFTVRSNVGAERLAVDKKGGGRLESTRGPRETVSTPSDPLSLPLPPRGAGKRGEIATL